MTSNALDAVTLLDVLIDGFEKNEVRYGYHWRELPMPNEVAAVRQFARLAQEARRWKGERARTEQGSEPPCSANDVLAEMVQDYRRGHAEE
jgi:hypothetical protein